MHFSNHRVVVVVSVGEVALAGAAGVGCLMQVVALGHREVNPLPMRQNKNDLTALWA